MNKIIRNPVGLINLLIIGVLASGCVGKATTFTITDAKMCTSVEDGNPVGATSTFNTTASELNVWISWKHAPRGTELKTVWIYETDNQTIGEYPAIIKDIDGWASFKLTRTVGWPVGDYRVDIYADGKLEKSVDFCVQ